MLFTAPLLIAVVLAAVGCASAQDVDDSDYQYYCNPARGGAICGRITGSDENYTVPGSQIDHAGFAADGKCMCPETLVLRNTHELT